MHLLYKLTMLLAGSLCALMMVVVGAYDVAMVLASCVLLVLLDVPELLGGLIGGGERD